MLYAFTIYKEGHTPEPVDIVYNNDGTGANGLPFDVAKKIAFYLSMGYTVTDKHTDKTY